MSNKTIQEALAEVQRKINEQRMKNSESNFNSIEEAGEWSKLTPEQQKVRLDADQQARKTNPVTRKVPDVVRRQRAAEQNPQMPQTMRDTASGAAALTPAGAALGAAQNISQGEYGSAALTAAGGAAGPVIGKAVGAARRALGARNVLPRGTTAGNAAKNITPPQSTAVTTRSNVPAAPAAPMSTAVGRPAPPTYQARFTGNAKPAGAPFSPRTAAAGALGALAGAGATKVAMDSRSADAAGTTTEAPKVAPAAKPSVASTLGAGPGKFTLAGPRSETQPTMAAPAAKPARAPAPKPVAKAAPAAKPAAAPAPAKSSFVEPASSSEGGESASSFFAKDIERQKAGKVQGPSNPNRTKNEETMSNSPMIEAFLRLQAKKAANIFEAAKKMKKSDIAALEHPKGEIDAKDLAALRAGKHKVEEGNSKALRSMKEEMGTGMVKKDGKDYVPDSIAKNPNMQVKDGLSKSNKKALDNKFKEVAKEEFEQIDEISTSKAIKTAVKRQAGAQGAAIERGDELNDREKNKIARSQRLIKNKYGEKGGKIVSKAVGKKIGYQGESVEQMFSEAELAYFESVAPTPDDYSGSHNGPSKRDLTDETVLEGRKPTGNPRGVAAGSKRGSYKRKGETAGEKEEGAAETKSVAAQVRDAHSPKMDDKSFGSSGYIELKHPATDTTHKIKTSHVDKFNSDYAAANKPEEKHAVERAFINKHMGGGAASKQTHRAVELEPTSIEKSTAATGMNRAKVTLPKLQRMGGSANLAKLKAVSSKKVD